MYGVPTQIERKKISLTPFLAQAGYHGFGEYSYEESKEKGSENDCDSQLPIC